MLRYSLKRLFQSLFTLLAIVTIVFLLMHLLPNEYYFTEEEVIKWTDQQKADALAASGLLDPLPIQLFRYYGNLFRFDFGTSRRLQSGVPVMQIIASKFAISMRLGLIGLAFSMVLGISMGILQTRHKDGIIDGIGTGYTVFVNAVPAIVRYSLILFFGSRFLKLPSMYSIRKPVLSAILPVACLTLTSLARYALWVRRYMVDELNKDYIKLARIKGMSNKQIMVSHVLKNAMVPMVQYIPASVLLTVGGSLLVERFFSIPGMGPLMTDAIGRYDINVVQTCILVYASLGILGVFLGDVLMSIIDPRIRLTGKGSTR